MNTPILYKSMRNSDPCCSDIETMAERELAAFFKAVTELFGSEQAELSGEDWLRELLASDALPASIREWRSFTAKVAARLANRVNSLSLSTKFTIA